MAIKAIPQLIADRQGWGLLG